MAGCGVGSELQASLAFLVCEPLLPIVRPLSFLKWLATEAAAWDTMFDGVFGVGGVLMGWSPRMYGVGGICMLLKRLCGDEASSLIVLLD